MDRFRGGRRDRTSRTRWSAIGAAVAVTVGAGGLLPASASVSEGERAVFIAITPCRLFDTRPAPDTIGNRSSALAASDTFAIKATGPQGRCSLPLDAIAVSMNVVAADPTAASYLTVWPSDATRPLAANLNWVTGQPPTPNKVDVDLSADGRVSFFNFAGTVNVIADVVGYYADHNHDDRYYTKTEADQQLAAVAGDGAEVITVKGTTPTPFPTGQIQGGGPLGVQLQSPFTTTRDSRLAVTLTAVARWDCLSNTFLYAWIQIDDVPLRDSLIRMEESTGRRDVITLASATDVVVPAGDHIAEFQVACLTGTIGSFSVFIETTGLVTYAAG